jgi:hypothetical protein
MQKKTISQQLCEKKTPINITCPNQQEINIGYFTVMYNCETGAIANSSFWESGNRCPDAPLGLPYP